MQPIRVPSRYAPPQHRRGGAHLRIRTSIFDQNLVVRGARVHHHHTMRVYLTVFAFLCLLAGPGNLAAQHVGATVRVGTGGIGVGLATQFSSTLNGRVDVSYFTYALTGEDEIDATQFEYEGDGHLFFASALADWHPFRSGLRISGGAMYNGIEGRGSAVPIEDIEVGSNSYSPDEVGTLDVDVTFGSKLAPYIGFGYGNAVTRQLGFLLDIGVVYAGSPTVEMDATEMLTPVALESDQIEQNLEWIRWYPLVSIGFNVRLN